MEYKGWTITRGVKQFNHGIEVSGWLLRKGNRETMAESKELAMKYIDRIEGEPKNE